MTATPDAFSTADLEAMLANAPTDITDLASNEAEDTDDRVQRLIAIAEAAVNDVTDDLDGRDAAQVHKIMLHMMIARFCEWHIEVAERANEHCTRSAMGWARDAGKFQAIMNILSTIEVDEDDFTCAAK